MIIRNKSEMPTIKFHLLERSDCFIFEDDYYMVIQEHDGYNAVSLSEGVLYAFDDDDLVTRIIAEMEVRML